MDPKDPKISREEFHELAKMLGYVKKTNPRSILRHLARKPDIVVDVGVRSGTRWLYRAFPKSRFVLVDPQRSDLWALESQPADFEIVTKGLSDKAGRLELSDEGGRSSFHTRTKLTSHDVDETYSVDVVTFDQMADELSLKGKIGVKIDVEGHELSVLRGIKKYRKSIDFIAVEMSVLNRFEKAPNFSDVVAEMRDMGFRFYNIMNHSRARTPLHYDGMFLQADDPAFDATERTTKAMLEKG